MTKLAPAESPRGLSRTIVVAAAAASVAGAAVLYGMLGGAGKESPNPCAPSADLAAKLSPFARGEIAALAISRIPKPAVEVAFDGPDGARRSLADFKGKALLLNLWATWCIPCREEMPALDRLQATEGGDRFEVVTVSVDTARLDRRKSFLDEIGVRSLGFYSDSSADIFQRLKRAGKVLGLPTTLVIDARGCEVGLMAGPADWASGDARKFVETLKAL